MPVTSNILSSLTTTRMPSGGLVRSSLSSRIRRRRTAGETDYKNYINEHKMTTTMAFKNIPWVQKAGGAWLAGS